MKKILISLFLLGTLQLQANDCANLTLKINTSYDTIKRINKLIERNKVLYLKYQDQLSKKIKLSSNALILKTKKETFINNIAILQKTCVEKGCVCKR